MKNKLLRVSFVIWGLLLALLLGVLILSLTGVLHMPFLSWSSSAELIREDTFDLRDLTGLTVQGRSEDIRVTLVPGDALTVRQYGNPNKDAAFTDSRAAGSLTLKVPNRNWFDWFNWGEKYLEIELPASYAGNLELSTISGGVHCPDGFQLRALTLATTSGGIELGACSVDSLTLSTVSGGIRLDTATVTGDANLSVTSGGVRLGSLSCRSFDIGTVSGHISVETALSGAGRLHTTSGGISAAGVAVNGTVTVSTVSGGVKLSLAPGVNCDLKLSSVSGGLHGNVPLDRNGHKASGTIGTGGPLLSVSTTSGGITMNG